jgi:hypothetical protein
MILQICRQCGIKGCGDLEIANLKKMWKEEVVMAYFEERSLHVLVVSEKNNEHFMTVAPK